MKNTILNQIQNITSKLIEAGLSVEQNFPSLVNNKLYISGKHDLSIAMKNISYEEIYNILNKEKNYNIKMIDGALIQMMYEFDNNDLKKYRLAFFPSPTLEEFQNEAELYEIDEIYADVLHKNIVTTPLRFDYDSNEEIYIPIEHSKSHLTIGQYKNCRIPILKPITPYMFVDFILRNFYNTAHKKYSEELNFDKSSLFEDSLQDCEKSVLHISIN
jgi:hypothetical protein